MGPTMRSWTIGRWISRSLLVILAIWLLGFQSTLSAEAAGPPVVPRFEGAVRANVIAIYRHGQELGNRSGVFAKVGDSITASDSFLKGFACGEERLGRYGSLAATISYYGRTRLPDSYASVWCGVADSFSRSSAAASEGWSARDALGPSTDLPEGCFVPYNTPLSCELHLLRPLAALIMYGTNDLERYNNLNSFKRNLNRIVRVSAEAGVIPILSTIPPRRDSERLGRRVGPHNRVIRAVAKEQRVPFVNYWRAMAGRSMVDQGISEDGVHPNLYGLCREPLGCQSSTLTSDGLRYGYNQRNFTALKALERLRLLIETQPS